MFIRLQSLQRRVDCDVQTGGVGSAVTNPDMLSSLMRSESEPKPLIRTSDTISTAEGFPLKTVCEILEN